MKKFLILAFTSLLTFSVIACDTGEKFSPSSAQGLYDGTIKVGHLVALDMAPLFVAKEAGYFQDEGLDVETVFFSNPGDNNAALTGESVQFSINPFTLAYLGQNSGVPMRIISNAGGNGIMQVVIQGKYDVSSMQVLATWVKANPGKKLKVGTLRGDTLDMILYRGFQEIGLTYDDFEMVWYNDLLAMVQTFQTGEIDILSHIQPYTTDLQVNYEAKLLTNNADVWGVGTPNTTSMILEDFGKKYPETVKKYLRASNKALELIKKDPEQAMKFLAGKNYYKVPDDVLLTSFRTQKDATLYPNIEGMNMAIADMVSQKYIEPTQVNIVDTSYLDASFLKEQ